MQESLIQSHGLELCIQTFGLKEDPCIILISGAAGQSILWNQILCQNLAKAGYFVIRFDNRDTGKSSGIIFDESPYKLYDMAGDVISILDKLNISKAHIVGMSMGGYIAQLLAIYFSNKIITLTFIMTTINSLSLRGIRNINNLPGQNIEIVQKIAQMYQTPRLNNNDRVKSLTDIWALFNGSKANFPYDELYNLAQESYARARSKNAVKNHRLAILSSEADRTEALKDLKIPTLVIHGEADPIIHIDHAHYIKAKLPQTNLLIIKKMGHILSSLFIDQVEDELLKHIEGIK